MARERNFKDYCKTKCMRIHKGIPLPKLDDKNCKLCKRIFTPTRSGQIFCEAKCRLQDIENNKLRSVKDFSIFKRDSFTCIYCGKSSIEDNVKLHVEHIIPISKGGKTELKNLITSCSDCNSCKNELRLIECDENRVVTVLGSRNFNLTPCQISDISKEIDILRVADKQRINRPQERL